MKKTLKLIGVSPRLLTEEGTEKEFVNRNYVNQLLKYNCNVIVLTLNNPKIEEVLSLCDGFLITGGADINPQYFGEENLGLSKEVIADLDIIDKQMIDFAVKHKKPVLGICRGHQSLNVFLGGTLYQDIGDSHRRILSNHEVKTIPNEVLAFDEEILVNSYHHQAVNKPAPCMQVIAYHTDGTAEAIVHESLPFIGIQWHPERLPDEKSTKTIFDKFFEYVNNQK